jgi:hypothetical protein
MFTSVEPVRTSAMLRTTESTTEVRIKKDAGLQNWSSAIPHWSILLFTYIHGIDHRLTLVWSKLFNSDADKIRNLLEIPPGFDYMICPKIRALIKLP